MYYDTPIHPGAMTPRQIVRNVMRYATAVLFTASAIACLFTIVILTN